MTADAVGGVWTYALELARALEPHGVEFALALMGPGPMAAQSAEAAALPNVTLYEGGQALEWMNDPWTEVDQAGEWLLELAENFEPDVVHLNGYVHAALPWGVPVLVAAHSCVFSWWRAVLGEEVPAIYDEYQRRVAAGLAAADLLVAPTADMLRALGEHYGALADGWVIHNARVTSGFAPALKKRPQIFAAGRAWDAAKNLTVLNAAAPETKWPIYLAGECQHPVTGQVAGFDSLHRLGKLNGQAMRRRLAESAIYALPARYEPFGLSALEAGLCGCALVLGDIPSLREVWGDAAVFVDPADAEGLIQTLNALIDDEDCRLDLGRRAQERARLYSPERMAAGYLEAYWFCLQNVPAEVAA